MGLVQTLVRSFLPVQKKQKKEETVPPVYKSRWGYHPFPQETHLKLKRLHKWAFEGYHKHCALIRWCAKREQRPDREPQVDPRFTTRGAPWRDRGVMAQYFKDVETGKHHLQHIEKTERHPVTEDLLSIHCQVADLVEDFRNSRMPIDVPEEVCSTNMTVELIDDLYEEIFEEGDLERESIS